MASTRASGEELNTANHPQLSTGIIHALASSPVIFYQSSVADSSDVLSVSPNAATVLGYDAKSFELDPSYLNRLVHASDRSGYETTVRYLCEGEPGSIEYRIENAQGDWVWFRDHLALIEQGDDRPVCFTGCLTDISAEIALRNKAEDAELALQDMTQDYTDAIDSLVSGFCLTSKDGLIIAINKPLAQVAGHDGDWFLGHPLRRLTDAIMSNFAIFEGEAVEQTEEWADHITKTMEESTGKSVEVKMTTGEWVLITLDATSLGGQSAVSTDISLQKRVEEELRESEVHFRTLVENHPLPVILVDYRTGEVVYESPAASSMFGRDENSTVAFHVQELYANPDDRHDFIRALKETGELRDYPIHYQRQDGSTYWISCNSKLVNVNGRDMHITSIMDLSEQLEREGALKKANDVLEDAIEALSEGFALFDEDSRLITCNSQYLEFNTTGRENLVPGASYEDLIRAGSDSGDYYANGEKLAAFFAMHYDADGNRVPVRNFEFRLQKDFRWLLYSCLPTRQNGFVITLTDITRSKAMEIALRDSEESVRQILEASPTPIAVSRREDSVVLYESPKSRELFQRSSVGPGIVVTDFWAHPPERARIWKMLEAEGEVNDQEVEFLKVDGTAFWASFSAKLISYQDKQLIVSTVFDQTESRALQEEMSRQREVLHVSEKMSAMGELLASVSHELNNPLSVVVGQTLLLEETANDPKVAARAEKIGKAADRCARIVKTFLAMARQETGERQQADANNMIDMALELTGYSLRGANIEVSTNLSTALPMVHVNPDQITQVLTNLVVNAEHALRQKDDGRRVRITSGYSDGSDHVVIKVKDNGPGVPNEIRRRIFEPFFTTKEVGEGTGIGLALCHRLIEANGGKIKMFSQPGRGASFTIRLPIGLDISEEVNKTSDVATDSRTLSVLIVDDEPEVAELIAEILQLDGHHTEIANNGLLALKALEKTDFQIILSDLRMPDFDGPWLFDKLQDQYPELVSRTAFVTGDTLSSDIAMFLKNAGRPHIEKPITPKEVRSLVSLLLAP
jgi:PAS domain S-box-containing protein